MQKTSTYRKIRDVLTAAAKHTGGIKELAESIYGKSDSFVYYKRDGSGKAREHPCDTATIRRSIRFCIDLGLIDSEEDCTLTDLGKNARVKDRFDLQLQQGVLSYLDKNSVSWQRIESAINKLPLSHVDSLYQYLSPSLSQDLFRTCLFLLSECGEAKGQNILKSFQRKIYLTEAKLQRMSQLEGRKQ